MAAAESIPSQTVPMIARDTVAISAEELNHLLNGYSFNADPMTFSAAMLCQRVITSPRVIKARAAASQHAETATVEENYNA